jgi:hypothetical protein
MPNATQSARRVTVALALGGAVLAVAATMTDVRPRAHHATLATAPVDAPADGVGPHDLLRRFALHGLLLPLVDADSSPARWQDPSLALPCGPATRVSVDGGPVPVGSAWNGRAFTVRWQLDACQPFGPDGVLLHGQVELDVFPENEGLSAIMRVGTTPQAGAATAPGFVTQASWTL